MSATEITAGPYGLTSKIAAYPYGELWEGSGPGGKILALVLDAKIDDAAQVAEKIEADARKLNSAWAVRWIDHGETDDGRAWLAAPRTGDVSLSEAASDGALSPPEATRIAHQIARALVLAAEAGLVHHALSGDLVRLIKLDGDAGYAVKIYGFGLAGNIPPYKPMKKKDPFLGAPAYMAPELCGGKPADEQADVYSVGTLLYEAIRGRAPFAPTVKGASASATMKRHIFEKPLPLRLRHAKVPHIKEYEAVVLKALDKKPERRFPSLQAFVDELGRLLGDVMGVEPVAASSVPRGKSSKPKRKTQMLSGLGDQLAAAGVTQAPKPAPEEPSAPEEPTDAPARDDEGGPSAAASPTGRPAGGGRKRRSATLLFAGLGLPNAPGGPASAGEDEEEPEEEEEAPEAAEDEPAEDEGEATAGASVGAEPDAGEDEGEDEDEDAQEPAGGAAAPRAEEPAAAPKPKRKAKDGPVTLPLGSKGTGGGAHKAPRSRTDEEDTQLDPMNAAAAEPESGDAWFMSDSEKLTGYEDDDDAFGNKKPGAMVWVSLLVVAVIVAAVLYFVLSSRGTPPEPVRAPVKSTPHKKLTASAGGKSKGAPAPQPLGTTGAVGDAAKAADAGTAHGDAGTVAAATDAGAVVASPDAGAAGKVDAGAAASIDAGPASPKDAAAAAPNAGPSKRELAMEAFAKGSQAESRGDLDAAETAYGQALSTDPTYSTAREALAAVRTKKKAIAEAKAKAAADAKAKAAAAAKARAAADAKAHERSSTTAASDAAAEARAKAAAAKAKAKAAAARAKAAAEAKAKAKAAAAAKAKAAAEAKAKAAAEAKAKAANAGGNDKAASNRVLKLGMGAYKKGNYALAAKYFAKAKQLDSTNQLAAKYLKAARAKMGK